MRIGSSHEWVGPLLYALFPVGMLGVGAYKVVDARHFLAESRPASAEVVAMSEQNTDSGYAFCTATIEFSARDERVRTQLAFGGYWPESGSAGCAGVGTHAAIRYRLSDPTDVRQAGNPFGTASQLLLTGAVFATPGLLLGMLLLTVWRRGRRSDPPSSGGSNGEGLAVADSGSAASPGSGRDPPG
jgi:hypothetical protein